MTPEKAAIITLRLVGLALISYGCYALGGLPACCIAAGIWLAVPSRYLV